MATFKLKKETFTSCLKTVQFENIQRQTDQGKMVDLTARRKLASEVRNGYDHQHTKCKWKKEVLTDSCMTRKGSENIKQSSKEVTARETEGLGGLKPNAR